MSSSKRTELATALRRRILRALQTGAVKPGSRLPGTRELAAEFHVDPRLVTAAYRVLADDGLVELRPRSGVYIHPSLRIEHRQPLPSTQWLTETFAQGISRGIPAPKLPATLNDVLRSRPLRVVVVAGTLDQRVRICRELHDDFGLQAHDVPASQLRMRSELPPAVRRAHFLLATAEHMSRVQAIGARLGKPVVQITMRRGLFDAEWALFRGDEGYVLVADPRFARMTRDYLSTVGAARDIHVLVAGRDDISGIPDDAPVYATQAARKMLGVTRLPKGLLPLARMISDESVVALLKTMLEI
jgi:DNA-binding transcriptional regulator YhcF (GntR family)